mgnify:CR=1 FL=1
MVAGMQTKPKPQEPDEYLNAVAARGTVGVPVPYSDEEMLDIMGDEIWDRMMYEGTALDPEIVAFMEQEYGVIPDFTGSDTSFWGDAWDGFGSKFSSYGSQQGRSLAGRIYQPGDSVWDTVTNTYSFAYDMYSDVIGIVTNIGDHFNLPGLFTGETQAVWNNTFDAFSRGYDKLTTSYDYYQSGNGYAFGDLWGDTGYDLFTGLASGGPLGLRNSTMMRSLASGVDNFGNGLSNTIYEALSDNSLQKSSLRYLEADMGSQSPWPIGVEPVPYTMSVGTQFNMVIDENQFSGIYGPGGFGTFSDIPNQSFAREFLAITDQFKSDVSYVQRFEVIQPLDTLKGAIGSQINPLSNRLHVGSNNVFQLDFSKIPFDQRINYIKPVGNPNKLGN